MNRKQVRFTLCLICILLSVAAIGLFFFLSLWGKTPKITTDFSERDIISFLILLVVLSLWSCSLLYRILDKRIKRLFFLLSLTIIIWILSGILKRMTYDSPGFDHVLWYGSYWALLMIPTIWVLIIFQSFLPPKARRAEPYILGADVILFLFVATNDLHHLIFVFPSPGSNHGYTYNFGYFIVYAYIFSLFIGGVIIFIWNTRGINHFRQTWSIWLLIITVVSYSIFFLTDYHWIATHTIVLRNYYVTYSLGSAALAELSLHSGLIQNSGFYQRYFNYSSFSLALTDSAYCPIFKSDKFQMAEEIKNQDTCLVNNIRYQKEKKLDGYLLSEKDLTYVLKMQSELQKRKEELTKANSILKIQQSIEIEKEKMKEKRLLEAKVDKAISAESGRIRALVQLLPDKLTPELRDKYLPTIEELKIRICFLKQKCLFLINTQEDGRLSFDSFSLAMGSLLQDLRALGFTMACSYPNQSNGDSSFCLSLNELLFALILSSKNRKRDILLSVDLANSSLKMRLSPSQDLTDLKVFKNAHMEKEDDDLLIYIGGRS